MGPGPNCQKKENRRNHWEAQEQCTFMTQILTGFVAEMGMCADAESVFLLKTAQNGQKV